MRARVRERTHKTKLGPKLRDETDGACKGCTVHKVAHKITHRREITHTGAALLRCPKALFCIAVSQPHEQKIPLITLWRG